MIALAYRWTASVASTKVEALSHRHRAGLPQNHHLLPECQPVEAVLSVYHLSVLLAFQASVVPTLTIQDQVDWQAHPNLSRTFWQWEFRFLISWSRLALKA
jgi:hypothetical protein